MAKQLAEHSLIAGALRSSNKHPMRHHGTTVRTGVSGDGVAVERWPAAHGGTARLGRCEAGTVFEIVVPCRPS
jgi:hypothetical protein